ncbi:hypothetical protein Forpe1208_v005533 [Fusarium oxysporum f. sp. rapae]|uniref:F-box domain-containing protein n=1 Tax=Fusarium oxysporum f. sp. rapae TaxID=485398 RepID=A0A8J5P990_FUSOX|nr:hypothetical protein Forpe1208_v005533 [Fusarium oxysporum f. sp. rapae]
MSRNVSNFLLFLVGAVASLALGFLAVYLRKDKWVESEKIDCIDKLPAELKFQILEQCDSMSDVASLIAASPSVRACFRANQDKLLRYHISYIREIFYNDELIPLALMVARMRRRLERRYDMYQLVGLLEHFVRGGRSKLFQRKFDHWQENLIQIQDLVNICTDIQMLSPRACYNSSAAYAKPLLSKLWHHRFVETYLREEISTTMKYYGSRLMFPPRNNLSPELYVFLFTRNYVGSRLPDRHTADIVDVHVSIGRLGATSFREMVSIAGDPLKSQRTSKRRKAEIQSWRDMRTKVWEEEDKKALNGQMVVYNGFARLLRADEIVQS